MAVYKDAEFKAFLRLINKGQVKHWAQIADALNIDKNTVLRWKKLPEAQKAIAEGISTALDCMEQAGRYDWRMWEAKLKMLGITQKVDLRAEVRINPVNEILKRYGLLPNDE